MSSVPQEGDIIAYRLVELSTSWCPELSSFRVGTTVANIGATALVTEATTTLFGETGISVATEVMTVGCYFIAYRNYSKKTYLSIMQHKWHALW